MAKKLQLRNFPDDGAPVTVTTTESEADGIILEISQGGVVKYFASIRTNGVTELKVPSGVYRFNFHYSKAAGSAKITSAVETPTGKFPKSAANGSGTAEQGEHGLTAYRVEV